ncbi:MAG: hypothetical protein NTZ39_06605 [Methanoregula sp.]|nr:hypothetical protein [Methanoregula sp.]
MREKSLIQVYEWEHERTGSDVALSREILAITGITITEDGVPGKGARFEITVPKGMWRMVEANMTGN